MIGWGGPGVFVLGSRVAAVLSCSGAFKVSALGRGRRVVCFSHGTATVLALTLSSWVFLFFQRLEVRVPCPANMRPCIYRLGVPVFFPHLSEALKCCAPVSMNTAALPGRAAWASRAEKAERRSVLYTRGVKVRGRKGGEGERRLYRGWEQGGEGVGADTRGGRDAHAGRMRKGSEEGRRARGGLHWRGGVWMGAGGGGGGSFQTGRGKSRS